MQSYLKGVGEGFHTFALEWTPEKYAFFVDGYRFYEVAAGLSHIEEYMILSMEIPSKPEEIKDTVFPDVFVVDYVKVYKKKRGLSAGLPADAPAQTTRPAIYDESADGAKQIEEALAKAKKENKHVLLMFGANWCGWCHRLHKLFDSNAQIAAKLKQDFVLVMIDVNKNRNADLNRRYGNPTQFGLPVLVVLDAAGKALTTQDTGKLEEGDHHDPAKVMAFLNQWSPKK